MKTNCTLREARCPTQSYAYDKNGNLTSLTRTGSRAETLTYTYTSGTNRLGTLKTNGLRGFTFNYNALKLPRTVTKSSSTVTYVYDAEGNKLAA